MSILLGFTPFILFAILARALPITAALIAVAFLAAAISLWQRYRHGRAIKILEAGSVLLFGGLAVVTPAAGLVWTADEVHLAVDIGMLAIVLVSLAVRRPFTLQYAREQTPPAVWGSPLFVRANDIISGIWALAFALMAAADAALLAWPGTPGWVGIAATVLVLVAAVRFTLWYPAHLRAR